MTIAEIKSELSRVAKHEPLVEVTDPTCPVSVAYLVTDTPFGMLLVFNPESTEVALYGCRGGEVAAIVAKYPRIREQLILADARAN